MHSYVYRISYGRGAFLPVFGGAAATAAKAIENMAFLESKNLKKQKNVSAMSKKTWRCRLKTIKNSKKRPKMIKIEVIGVNLVRKGVFFEIYGPLGLLFALGDPLGGI